MTGLKVRCGGVWLDNRYELTGLRFSSRAVVDDYSGDYKASVTWGAPTGFSAPFVKSGQRFQVCQHGLVLWGGILGEPDPQSDSWDLFAYGYGNQAQYFPAIENTAAPGDPPVYVPSTKPNTVVDLAIEMGAPWTRVEDLGDVPISDPDGEITDVLKLLTRAAQAQGKRVHFDSYGEVTFVADPTDSTWTVGPKEADIGTQDDDFITRLFGFYRRKNAITSADEGYRSVVAEDDEAAAQYGGHRARSIKMYNLGLMYETDAQAFIDGRFALVGARSAFTKQVVLTSLALRRLGAAAAPGAQRFVRAGTGLRMPGVMDTRSQPQTRASVMIPIGQLEYVADDDTAVADPVGFKPRGFDAAFEEPPEPTVTDA